MIKNTIDLTKDDLDRVLYLDLGENNFPEFSHLGHSNIGKLYLTESLLLRSAIRQQV